MTKILIPVLTGRTYYTSNKTGNSDDGATPEVELGRERYGVHRFLGLVVKCNFIIFGGDDAGEKLAVDVDPCVFRHKELMQVPCELRFIERVGLEIP